MSDTRIAELWAEWKRQHVRVGNTTSHEISQKRHDALMDLEKAMLAEPAEGPAGIAVKLGLWRYWTGGGDPDDIAHACALAALADLVRLTGLDSFAEAEALWRSEDAPSGRVVLFSDWPREPGQP